MKRNQKGEFGYIKKARRNKIIYTVFLFAISLSLFISAFLLTKTKRNLLTVVAVLGMLPASKALVDSIMLIKAKPTSKDVYSKVKTVVTNCKETFPTAHMTVLYDLYFTSEKKNFPVSAMILRGKTICFYMENSKDHCQGVTKHLNEIFNQNKFNGYTIKGYDQLDKFLDRVETLSGVSMEKDEFDPFVLETILNISL